jgi:DNA-binding NarL/FixJ family response regulator
MDNINILLAEDHGITREGIRILLEDEQGFRLWVNGNGNKLCLDEELKRISYAGHRHAHSMASKRPSESKQNPIAILILRLTMIRVCICC